MKTIAHHAFKLPVQPYCLMYILLYYELQRKYVRMRALEQKLPSEPDGEKVKILKLCVKQHKTTSFYPCNITIQTMDVTLKSCSEWHDY